MKKFIFLQFTRSYNFIVSFWKFFVFENVNDVMSDFTIFGKYFMGFMLGILAFFMSIVFLACMPLILIMFKYDESIGF